MKTVFIPTSYNPIQLHYVIQNFKNKWYNTVDKLYISFDSEHINQLFLQNFLFESNFENIKELCYHLCDDKKITIINKEKENFFLKNNQEYIFLKDSRASEIRQLISNLDTDEFFITHDDIFYLDDVFIKEMFCRLNEYDVVGLATQSSENSEFKINEGQLNEKYLGFSSHNFFSKLNIIKNTDGIFNSINISNKLPYVNVDYKQTYLEYFVPFSLQLYSLKNKLFFYKEECFENNCQIEYINDEQSPKFIHFNLGSSFLLYLLNPDYYYRTVESHLNSNLSYINMFARRLSMYKYFYDNYPVDIIEKYKLNILFKMTENNLYNNINYLYETRGINVDMSKFLKIYKKYI